MRCLAWPSTPACQLSLPGTLEHTSGAKVWAGIFTACIQIISLAVSITRETRALVYFWVANATIAFTLLLMAVIMRRNRFYLFYMENYEQRKGKMLSFRQILDIFKVIWPGPGIMFFYLATTNIVHPAITSLVVSEGEGNGPWNGETIPSKNTTNT
jgi:nitrogen fixation/metabolism regulation signal transduction histidine kinase